LNIAEEEIVRAFELLNESSCEYILMRNIGNEIPGHLEYGKDIDILIRHSCKNRMVDFLKDNGFCRAKHPLERDVFLYGVQPCIQMKNKAGVLFDLNFDLAVRSLDAGQWIPLDQRIQGSVWENKKVRKNKDFKYWAMDYEDELVTLVARSVFDKKIFSYGYINRISELLSLIDEESILCKLKLIFFKFTPFLMEYLKRGEYEIIFKKYIEFKNY